MCYNDYDDWRDEEIRRLESEVRDLEDQLEDARNEIRRLHTVINQSDKGEK